MPKTAKPRINPTEYRNFLKTLPEDVQQESYRYLNLQFSVPHALFVIQQFKIEVKTATRPEIERLAQNYGVAYPQLEQGQRSYNLFDRVLNDEWMSQLLNQPNIAQYPLKQAPLIFIQATIGRNKNRQQCCFLIDGGHRLRYHYMSRSESVQLHIIPNAYAHLVQRR